MRSYLITYNEVLFVVIARDHDSISVLTSIPLFRSHKSLKTLGCDTLRTHIRGSLNKPLGDENPIQFITFPLQPGSLTLFTTGWLANPVSGKSSLRSGY